METYATIKNGCVLFWGGIYSNFYPCEIHLSGHTFKTSEQVYMYEKAMFFGDKEIAEQILKTDDPKECQNLGRKVRNFDMYKWAEERERAMRIAVMAKFLQNKELREELISDKYNTLKFVECNPNDIIWGIGYDEEHAFDVSVLSWGMNLLGKIINQVRSFLVNND